MEQDSEQAGTNCVKFDPQHLSSNGDVRPQEEEANLDNKNTTSSSVLLPEQSIEARNDNEEKAVINAFLLTASFLVDVYASKVGLSISLLLVYLLLKKICLVY